MAEVWFREFGPDYIYFFFDIGYFCRTSCRLPTDDYLFPHAKTATIHVFVGAC